MSSIPKFVICSPLFPSLDWYQMFTLVKKDSLYCSEPILTLTMWPCVDEKRMNTVGSAASDVFVWECRRNVNSVLSYACLEKFLDHQSNGETSAAWQTWQLMSQHPFMSADNHWCLFAINVWFLQHRLDTSAEDDFTDTAYGLLDTVALQVQPIHGFCSECLHYHWMCWSHKKLR